MRDCRVVAIMMACAGFVLVAALPVSAQDPPSSPLAPSPHTLRTPKFTIGDVDETTAFYEQMFGMTEVRRAVFEGFMVEPVMGYGTGADVALLAPLEKETIEKSPYPVAVIYTSDFDEWTTRIEQARHPLVRLPASDTDGVRTAITRDPSGNAIEIVERAGAPAVGGSRLIVDDRARSEAFFVRVFGPTGVTPGQRFETETFDEVIMEFGDGTFVALFEPKGAPALPKSTFPVVAINTTAFDAVLQRVKAAGLEHRGEFGGSMFLVTDPAGNVVEIANCHVVTCHP